MIQEKEIELNGKTYIISKIPATVAREILLVYPTSNLPKIGDYPKSEEIMLKLMSYVGVKIDGDRIIELKTKQLIDNHVPNAVDLMMLEKEMFKYNYDFFTDGSLSSFLTGLESKATQKGTEILMILLDRLSQAGKPH